MKATSGQKVRTGIFAIAGLVLLIGAVFLIGKKQNMFGDTFHIYGTFKNVGGLQVGNNVRFVGVNVGTVESIKIVSDTVARVDMIIRNKVHPFIKSDAMASIGSDGLMGDKLISIASTSENATLIKDGGMIATVNPTDFSKIITRVEQIADNAQIITDGLADIATQISSGKGSVGRLLYSDDLSKNLEGSVNNLKKGTAGFSENMTALKHNFLLKGYYKKKERAKEEEAERQAAGSDTTTHMSKKEERKAARKAKKENK
jgi:phospholipid/cholesterol/gamma-HCH transport system substrate-binding protein